MSSAEILLAVVVPLAIWAVLLVFVLAILVVQLVCDNLNTHTKGAFYEAFEPERTRQLVRRIEFCYPPKQGS